jgi:hypothetical protein
MAALAGTSWSFDKASRHLKEFCHVEVSDDTIERVCQEEGQRAGQWMEQSEAPVEALARAKGEVEFSSDGLKINTVNGWREMRLSVFVKRPPTGPCAPAQWDDRVLNEPQARLAFCRLADATHVGAGWGRWSKRLGLKEAMIHVIADGAKWIWDQARRRLSPQARWCVDVYHVSEHLHDCGKAMWGQGAAARAWASQRLRHVLEHNGPGLIGRLESERQALNTPRSAPGAANPQATALDRLLNYLRDNRDRMWYRDRLAAGQTIGSGLVEGACKNTIGARMRANSARWRVRRAEKLGTLRCVDDSNLWDNYWASRAA